MSRFLKLFLLFIFLAPALAAAKTTDLPEVVVKGQVGSQVSNSAEQARASLNRVAGSTSLISKEDYGKGRASTPQDILGWTPGLHVQSRDSAALESRISIRGSGLQRTFHLRGITVLQDGIPLNQADGSGESQRIEPLAVDYAEVYRGGNALRYGSGTLGGAINFVSPTGYTADLLQARFEVGSFGYIRSQISSGQVRGNFDSYVSVSQFLQEGFREHAAQDNYDIFANAGWKISDTVESRFYGTFIEAQSKLGGSLTKSQLFTNPEQPNALSLSQNRKRDFEFMRLASKTSFVNGEEKFELTGFWSSYDLFHPIAPVLFEDDDDWGGELRYSNDHERWGHKNAFVAGFSGTIGTVDQDRYVNVGGLPTVRAAESDNFAQNFTLYGEDSFYLWPKLALVAGTQLVYAVREIQDYFMPNGDDSGRTHYRSINPKAGLLYDVNENIQIFSNGSKSFEPPSFSELLNAAGDYLPNKAQVADTFEVGTRGTAGRYGWDIAYYHAWLDNELLSINAPDGTTLGTINAPSETIHQGVELGANTDIFREVLIKKDRVNLKLLYNWNDFRFNGDPAFGDNRLPSLPEHFFKAEWVYEMPTGFYAGPSMEQVFGHYPIDMANSFFAEPYTIWNFKAGFKQKKGLSVFFEIKNITDEIYAASTGIVANARGLDQAQFNPGSGRAFYGGAEWRW